MVDGTPPNGYWSGRKVLVTGAGGFIGSHLVQALVEAGASVRALAHYNSRNEWGHLDLLPANVLASIEVILGDVQDPSGTRAAVKGREIVFHLAALIAIPYSYVAPSMYVDTNVRGTLNILEAARELAVGLVVQTSTSETYGTALYTPIDEAHALQGQSPYSASKIGADKLAESYHRSFDLPVATIRPFNTYGPRQSARAVIPTIVTQALRGDSVRLGSLTPVRDLNFVQDTVEGFLAVARSDRAIGHVINVGAGKGISIGDLAARIGRLMGKDLRIEADDARVRPSGSEVFELVCDNRRALEWTGWKPSHTLDEGLARTIAWIADNQGRFKPTMYTV